MRNVICVVVLCLIGGSVLAADLYHVTIRSEQEAQALRQAGTLPLTPTESGYLVLAGKAASERLFAAGLENELIETDIARDELAIGIRLDGTTSANCELIYQNGGLRLYRVMYDLFATAKEPTGLAPLLAARVPIVFEDPIKADAVKLRYDIDLESIVAEVSQDSLSSYSHYMEDHFWRRVAGTSTNYMARTWMMNKFAEFGYDSVVSQDFQEVIDGTMRTCSNVLAYKIGSEYPLHQILVGAHRDAVPASPGGDDNGSGTSAVLEMARVIAGLETKMTIVFALFDAEEWGLFGSYYYANQADLNGDSLVFMLNQDMIAHFQNNSDANVYGENEYNDLWIQLADSLTGINLTGHNWGYSGGSDHVPFAMLGYKAIFAQEYNFSTVYHSYQDSTSYMNFEYMRRMVQTSLATTIAVDDSYTPAPMAWFEFPEDRPELLYPERPYNLAVNIRDYAGASPLPETAVMHYVIDGDPEQTVPLEYLGGDSYVAHLPALACQSYVEYRMEVTDTSGMATLYPGDSTYQYAVASTGVVDLLNDGFAEDLGWAVSGNADDGAWERGIPIDLSYCGVPREDYDGNAYCYQTAVDYSHDVDDGTTSLASPQLFTDGHNAMIQYVRWYNNALGADPYNDSMVVRIYDGTNWYHTETVGPVQDADGGWVYRRYWLSEYITPGPVLRLRFDVSDMGDDSNVEAAVDAVRISQFSCNPLIITESLPDWTEGIDYDQLVDAVGGDGALTIADKYGDLAGTGLVLNADGTLTGTPLAAGPVSFTAEVTDEAMVTDERLYGFTLNPALSVSTGSLPMARQGQFYSEMLQAFGGTGTILWSDLNDDLAAFGLGIVENRIEGSPTDTVTLTFVARAADQVGAVDDQELTLVIGPSFVCGDANGDGSGPDIADLVYLVTYMFQNGPPPPVMAAVDVNSSGDGPDIADLVYLVTYMFQQGPEICPER